MNVREPCPGGVYCTPLVAGSGQNQPGYLVRNRILRAMTGLEKQGVGAGLLPPHPLLPFRLDRAILRRDGEDRSPRRDREIALLFAHDTVRAHRLYGRVRPLPIALGNIVKEETFGELRAAR